MSWIRALIPNGILCVCYWPRKVESVGPWKRMMEIDPPNEKDNDWEENMAHHVIQAGAEIVADRCIAHDIEWPSAPACWNGIIT